MKVYTLIKLLSVCGLIALPYIAIGQRPNIDKPRVIGDPLVPVSDHTLAEYLSWVSSKWNKPMGNRGEMGYGNPEAVLTAGMSGIAGPLNEHLRNNAQNGLSIGSGWRFRVPIKDKTRVSTLPVVGVDFTSKMLQTPRDVHLTAITEFGLDANNVVVFIYVYFDPNNNLENRFQVGDLFAQNNGWSYGNAAMRLTGANFTGIGWRPANQVINQFSAGQGPKDIFATVGRMVTAAGTAVGVQIRAYGYPFGPLINSPDRLYYDGNTKTAYSGYTTAMLIGKVSPNWKPFFINMDDLTP